MSQTENKKVQGQYRRNSGFLPATFNEGDFESAFHQPAVLDRQVQITGWTQRSLHLEGEEGLVSGETQDTSKVLNKWSLKNNQSSDGGWMMNGLNCRSNIFKVIFKSQFCCCTEHTYPTSASSWGYCKSGVQWYFLWVLEAMRHVQVCTSMVNMWLLSKVLWLHKVNKTMNCTKGMIYSK